MDTALPGRILAILGDFWNRVYSDKDSVAAQAAASAVLFDQIQSAAAALPSYQSRKSIPVWASRELSVLRFNEADLDTDVSHYGEQGLTYGYANRYGVRSNYLPQYRYPIPAGMSPAYLAVSVVAPGVVLTRDIDYTVQANAITFLQDPLLIPGLQQSATAVVDGVPSMSFVLWGFSCLVDLNAVSDFFGFFAGVSGMSSQRLKDAVNVAWDLRVTGASDRNLGRMLCVLTDVDYVEPVAGEQAVAIFQEGDRLFLQTNEGLYDAPQEMSALYGEGDILLTGPAFDAYSIYRGGMQVPFTSFDGLSLDVGYFPWLDVGHTLLFPNQLVPVSRQHAPGWLTVRKAPADTPGSSSSGSSSGSIPAQQYQLVNAAGQILDTVSEAAAEAALAAVPEDWYVFPVGSTLVDWQKLMALFNTGPLSFADQLRKRYGIVPVQINPMQELHCSYLSPNSTYIKLRYRDLDSRLTGQLLNVLRSTLPAGSAVFVVLDLRTYAEPASGSPSEAVDVFSAPEYVEAVPNRPGEKLFCGVYP